MNCPDIERVFAMHPQLRMRMHTPPKSAPGQKNTECRLMAHLGSPERSQRSLVKGGDQI
jgi:hypothetical protein